MNLLMQTSPDYITVGAEKIPIKTDFFLWVRFVAAFEKGDGEGLIKSIFLIAGDNVKINDAFITACISWLFPESGKAKKKAKKSAGAQSAAFQFEADGNVIFCELWQYFPALMQRGISFHEGIELIKLLLHNEKTMLWHRAFARCGSFEGMSKEQQKYWNRQRRIYKIKDGSISQEELDRRLYNSF